MGRFEVADYVEAVNHISSAYNAVDTARVGVFGWSYGGYATLLCLSQAPQVFKIGFAGAPVGDWLLYDTGYTERYLGLLPQDREVYTRSAISTFAAGFPDELNRVFIAHGLLDENVHFSHSCRIVDGMITHTKPYVMLVYPGERHGLRQRLQSRIHFETQMVMTFSQLL
jgi:dipeptidyl aminopeptidase/acylaminoacyl peptidase